MQNAKLEFILLTLFNVFVGADAHIGPIEGFLLGPMCLNRSLRLIR